MQNRNSLIPAVCTTIIAVTSSMTAAANPWTVIKSDDFGPADRAQPSLQVVVPPETSPSNVVTQLNELGSEAYPELARQYLESARWNERRGAIDDMVSNLKAAANYGSAGAHYELARLYLDGDKVERDLSEVSRHLYAAAGLGNAEAERVLGLTFIRGDLGTVDLAEGEARLTKAAETSIRAKRELAMWLAGQLDGVPKDVRRAQHYFEQAIAAGDSRAEELLAKIDPALLAAAKEPVTNELAGGLAGEPAGELQQAQGVSTEPSAGYSPTTEAAVVEPRRMPTAEELFTEANSIMLRPQSQRGIEDEARAFAMFSLAYELGSEMAGKELNYLDGVRAIKAKDDPQWLFKYKQKVISGFLTGEAN
ncbi:tetratricopeptide repeat protein [Marinobacter sp.]|uniref:tetratricopeptide repeat protein n=1 Tax=Marinobacter sp. TaxID=50741 RepID=UPI003A92AF09